MRRSIFALMLVVLPLSAYSQWGITGDRGGWGCRLTKHMSGGVLGDDEYSAADGFKAKGFSVSLERHQISETDANVWRSYSYGLTFRRLELTSTTSTTTFHFETLEIPFNINLAIHGGGWFPIALDAGVFAAIPLTYKGSIYRYQQPMYEYGNEKYEKPYGIFGFRGGISMPFDVARIRVCPFAHFNFGFIPIGSSPPDGVEAAFDIPVYRCAELGVTIVLWNKE